MRVRTVLVAGLAGAAVAYLFDPIAGRTRRSRLRERITAIAHRRMIGVGKRPPLPDNLIPAGVSERVDTPEEHTTKAVADASQKSTVDDIVYMPQERLRGYLADTRENRPMDDGAIVGRIRMKVTERPDLETGSLLIDVVQGVAFLRGELKDRKAIEEIVDLTRSVPGVRDVQNLLVIRLPESEAISRSAAPLLGDAWNG
jgi:osmotically-inducible protein OsmY